MDANEHNAVFERWLAEHAGVLHHVANGFAEGADRSDLMQELMLSLWRAVPAFRSGAKPSTFIYRVAHNTALTWKRTARNYERRVSSFAAQPQASGYSAATAPAEESDMLRRIYEAIRALPPLDRSLMLLHLDAVPYAEMAEIHGLTESNVGARLSRLKQKLIQQLQEVANELR